LLLQNSVKALDREKENSTIKDKIDTREEISKFANTCHLHLKKSCTQNKSLSFRRIPVLKG